MKQDFPPLLGPGIHDMDLKQMENLCVAPFCGQSNDPSVNQTRRERIWERFTAFLDQLRTTGLDYELWIDGSFVTEKEEPSDIDVVVFLDPAVSTLPRNHQSTLQHLLAKQNRATTKLRYLTDALSAPNGDANSRIYWRGCFGFDYHNKPKGFIRLILHAL